MPAMSKKCAAERLAPAQYLLLEYLAVCRVAGEDEVLLPHSALGIVKALEFQSLARWRTEGKSIMVSLTPAGIKTVESDSP